MALVTSLKILGEKEVGPGRVWSSSPGRPVSELPSPPSTSKAALLLQLPHLPADADPSGKVHIDLQVPMLGREEHSRDGVAGQSRAEIGLGVATPSSLTAPTPAVSPSWPAARDASATRAP